MTIEDRLENMERELGRLKRRDRWLLGAILLVAGGLIVPVMFETTAFRARAQLAQTAKEIRTSSFVLEDENGQGRGALTMIKDTPSLMLFDEKGQERATLTIFKDSPALMLMDKKGELRAQMIVIKDTPSMSLMDGKGQPRAQMIVIKDTPLMSLMDEKGQVIWSATK